MEHISEILKNLTDTSSRNTERFSGADEQDSDSCPVCRGARVVHPLLPTGKPDYSRVIPCRCTLQERDEETLSRLQRYSNLGPLMRLTFDNLLPAGKSENPVNRELFESAFQAARKYADSPEGWFVITGPSGCGKTHLAAAIANRCIAINRPALYVTTPDMLDYLRATFSPGSEINYDDFFERVKSSCLLVLDDLGIQSSTPWAREKLDQLLNHRFNNHLPTVIISIIPVSELDERIRTRLAAFPVYQLCSYDEDVSSLLAFSWGPEFKKQKAMTFDNFDWKRVDLPLEQRENLEKVFHFALEFAKSPEGWLVLQGVNGCGKTHLAAAIVNYRYQHGKPALFVVVPDFLDHLRSTFSPESKMSYDRIFEKVKSSPLLILDDFGKQSTTPWAQEKLYQVINYRYNAQLPTVVTTNCSSDELDSPILSRFADQQISTLFTIIAPDYFAGRQNKKNTTRRVQKHYQI